MKLEYPVHYKRDEENPALWEAKVPGLDGTEEGPGTCGDSLEDCRRMASGLIDSWISIYLKEGRPIPEPGAIPAGKGWEIARPSLRMAFVVMLRELRARRGWSQAEAAKRLKIAQPVYARLEDPAKANPTLETVQKLGDTLGVVLELKTA